MSSSETKDNSQGSSCCHEELRYVGIEKPGVSGQAEQVESRWVELNVGGKLFRTRCATLEKCCEAYQNRQRGWKKRNDGACSNYLAGYVNGNRRERERMDFEKN
eukprot:GHVS01063352.1.p2 GENE.GHVS01063352.1~~GHVS01063352.1.p2  ORF type:complete len:104 (-),score=16.31 GHVS01063352.1:65-376(-)